MSNTNIPNLRARIEAAKAVCDAATLKRRGVEPADGLLKLSYSRNTADHNPEWDGWVCMVNGPHGRTWVYSDSADEGGSAQQAESRADDLCARWNGYPAMLQGWLDMLALMEPLLLSEADVIRRQQQWDFDGGFIHPSLHGHNIATAAIALVEAACASLPEVA